MGEVIIAIILMIPIFGALIWTYLCPEESMMFGRRWMYKEEPEMSDEIIRYTKFSALVGMIATPFVFSSFLFELYVLRLWVVVLPIVLFVGFIRIYKGS